MDLAALSLEVLALTEEVRRAFMALRLAADATNAEDGIVASVRAVLQHLAEEGPLTVPAMAEAKAITRQAIQERVNVLLARGLAEVRRNPRHRRSGLVALTGEGAAVYRRMTAREAEALESVAAALEPGEAVRAMVTLRKLIAALNGAQPGAA